MSLISNKMFDNKGLAWLHRERLKLPNNTNDVALFVAFFFKKWELRTLVALPLFIFFSASFSFFSLASQSKEKMRRKGCLMPSRTTSLQFVREPNDRTIPPEADRFIDSFSRGDTFYFLSSLVSFGIHGWMYPRILQTLLLVVARKWHES